MKSNSMILNGIKELVSITVSIKDSSEEENNVSIKYNVTFKTLKGHFANIAELIKNLKLYNEKSKSIMENISKISTENKNINININNLLSSYNNLEKEEEGVKEADEEITETTN